MKVKVVAILICVCFVFLSCAGAKYDRLMDIKKRLKPRA